MSSRSQRAPEVDPSVACIYTGRVRHRRFTPKPHDFSYRLYMTYLELGRVGEVLDSVACASAKGPALVRYRRRDYFGNAELRLEDWIRDFVAERSGRRPQGPIRMLTHLRTWGVSFNPVSFFYCYDVDGEKLEHVVAEINNTPWGERYAYVLSDPEEEKTLTVRQGSGKGARSRPRRILTYRTGKTFHVSPFIDMDVRYLWKLSQPGETLLVHMEDHPENPRPTDGKIFDATLSMDHRLPLNTKNLLLSQARHPAMPAMVVLWIYRQALSLWLKKIPFYSHPKKRKGEAL